LIELDEIKRVLTKLSIESVFTLENQFLNLQQEKKNLEQKSVS